MKQGYRAWSWLHLQSIKCAIVSGGKQGVAFNGAGVPQGIPLMAGSAPGPQKIHLGHSVFYCEWLCRRKGLLFFP